jgi:hypothetical protein
VDATINIGPDAVLSKADIEGVTFDLDKTTDGKTLFIKMTTGDSDVVLENDQYFGSDSNVGLTTGDMNVGDYLNGSQIADGAASATIDSSSLINSVFNVNKESINTSSKLDFKFNAKQFSAKNKKGADGSMLDALLKTVSENGPVSMSVDETRIWLSPYATRTRMERSGDSTGNQGWVTGSLVGLEKRDDKNRWAIGAFTGLAMAKNHNLGDAQTFAKATLFTLGVNNSLKYTTHKDRGNFGHEILIARTLGKHNKQRRFTSKGSAYQALGSHKSTTDLGNAQLNYLFNIIKKKLTCRLSAGATYEGSKDFAYTERNSPANRYYSDNVNKSVEVYFGPGIRYIWERNKTVFRLTGVLEYGVETYKKSSGATVQNIVAGSKSYALSPGKKQNKYYAQLNLAVLNRSSGIKVIASYSGTYYSNNKNHTGMVKLEYRF